MRYKAIGWFSAYVGTVFGANLALAQWGVVTVFGIAAPAGAFFAGFAFTARDGLRETGGSRVAFGAIAAGAILSFMLEDAQRFAIASAVAFAIGESLDAAVYEPLRRRGKALALACSNVVGFTADSAIFLWLAFGSLQFIEGQLAIKAAMTALAVIGLIAYRAVRR